MRIDLQEACRLLRAGKVVAIPTDTVYGLAADPSQPEAIQRLIDLKRRPSTNPMIVLVGKPEAVHPFVDGVAEGFEQLTYAFWPGALTLVVPVNVGRLSSKIRAGRPNAGFRMPHHRAALDLLNAYGPLVVTSANLSGRVSATQASAVEAEFGEEVPVLHDGPTPGGIESTILVYHEREWAMVRRGAVTPFEIERVLGYLPEFMAHEKKIELATRLYSGGAVPTGGVVVGFEGRNYPGAARVYRIGSLDRPDEVARTLYSTLHQMEEEGIKEAWVDMDFPKEGILAVVDERLRGCQ